MGNMKLITIVNGMEDIVEVELLCAFESKKFDSKYIIYTKNEKDDHLCWQNCRKRRKTIPNEHRWFRVGTH